MSDVWSVCWFSQGHAELPLGDCLPFLPDSSMDGLWAHPCFQPVNACSLCCTWHLAFRRHLSHAVCAPPPRSMPLDNYSPTASAVERGNIPDLLWSLSLCFPETGAFFQWYSASGLSHRNCARRWHCCTQSTHLHCNKSLGGVEKLQPPSPLDWVRLSGNEFAFILHVKDRSIKIYSVKRLFLFLIVAV